jgi:hypothetical protein
MAQLRVTAPRMALGRPANALDARTFFEQVDRDHN